ncbi:MAG: hypothetical protein ACRDG3_01470 [Tepidiformaceae bacterium]
MPESTQVRAEPGDHEHARRPGTASPELQGGANPAKEFDLLGMQRLVGNQQVARMIARQAAANQTGPMRLVQRHPGPTIASPAGMFSKLFGGGAKAPKTDAQKKMDEIKAILGKSDAGKAALKVLDTYKVPVDLEYAGPGSVYQGPAPGKILLEATNGAEDAAFILVHEANHAKASNMGETANVSALARDVYVKTMINEETDSTVNSILAKLGMSKSNQKKITATPVMEARYQAAYDKTLAANKAAKTKASEAEKLARASGWQSINEAFYDGSLVTSNTGETYAVYYGSFWDKVNAPPAPAAI